MSYRIEGMPPGVGYPFIQVLLGGINVTRLLLQAPRRREPWPPPRLSKSPRGWLKAAKRRKPYVADFSCPHCPEGTPAYYVRCPQHDGAPVRLKQHVQPEALAQEGTGG